MKIRIRAYLDQLFARAPQSLAVFELKEELLANCYARYDDLLNAGHSEEEAYRIVVAGIGDVNELLAEISEQAVPGGAAASGGAEASEAKGASDSGRANETAGAGGFTPPEPQFERWYTQAAPENPSKEQNQLRRILFALGLGGGIFVLLGSPFFFLHDLLRGKIAYAISGISLAAILGIVLIVVASILFAPRRRAGSQRVLDDFQDYRQSKKHYNKAKGSLTSALWLLITAFYFIISFLTRAWYITWVIFVVGAALTRLIDVFYISKLQQRVEDSSAGADVEANRYRERRELRRFINSSLDALALIVFIFAGYFGGLWYISWVAFLVAAALKHLIYIGFAD